MIGSPAAWPRSSLALLLALGLVAAPFGGALAQDKKEPNPFQGFSAENGEPVVVTSESLEVHQNEQKAIFIGNVVAKQGESVLRTPRLVVFYDNAAQAGAAEGAAQATPARSTTAPTQANAIKRLEASGGVVVTSADQKATGADGVFDMASNTATLTGNVVLHQGQNVIRGKQLVVDMKTGVARVIGGTSGLFVPSKDQGAAAKPKAN
jgi:lipopolysaccharide export system protein LptA